MLDRLWFHVPRPCPEAALRLYCFHHAGGGASAYRAWPELVDNGVEVAAVRLPGRESRFAEPRFRRMADVVAALQGPLTASLDRPFAFFGHSLGALVAFETARAVTRAGGPGPVHLFAAASPAPGRGGHGNPLHILPAHALIERLREYGGLPEPVLAQRGLLSVLLPVIRDDLEIGYAYHTTASGRLRCPVTVLGGADDPTMSWDDLTAWRAATDGPFQILLVPGGHFCVHEAAAYTTATVMAALSFPPRHPGPPGDPANNEWRQYFIPDDQARPHERRPLEVGGRSSVQVRDDQRVGTNESHGLWRAAP